MNDISRKTLSAYILSREPADPDWAEQFAERYPNLSLLIKVQSIVISKETGIDIKTTRAIALMTAEMIIDLIERDNAPECMRSL